MPMRAGPVAYLACPRTGTNWIRRSLKRHCGWDAEVFGDHGHDARGDLCRGIPTFTVIRDPWRWLPSVYKKMLLDGWRPLPGPACVLGVLRSDSFSVFIQDMLMRMPGICSRVMGEYADAADFVGVTSSIEDGLVSFLVRYGVHPHVRFDLPPQEMSLPKPRVEWDSELLREVLQAEVELTERINEVTHLRVPDGGVVHGSARGAWPEGNAEAAAY